MSIKKNKSKKSKLSNVGTTIKSIIKVSLVVLTLVASAFLTSLGHEKYLYNGIGSSVVMLTNGRGGGTGFQIITNKRKKYILTNAHICSIGKQLIAHKSTGAREIVRVLKVGIHVPLRLVSRGKVFVGQHLQHALVVAIRISQSLDKRHWSLTEERTKGRISRTCLLLWGRWRPSLGLFVVSRNHEKFFNFIIVGTSMYSF